MKFLRIATLVLCLTLSETAIAAPALYVDAGGAYVNMRGTSSFYGGSVNSGTGYGMELSLWTSFRHSESPIEFQLGVDDRYESVSSSGRSFGLNLLYPAVRLQVSRAFFSFGYSPYVMSSAGGSSASSQTLSHVSGATAMLGEAGMLFPVTPKFSFGASGSIESVSSGAIKSPSPVVAGNVFMRFYFGFGDGSSKQSNEFRGWRYPFGRDLF